MLCNLDYHAPLAWVSVGTEMPEEGARCGVCAKQCQTDTRAKTRATRPRHWFRAAMGDKTVWTCSRACKARNEAAQWVERDGVWYCSPQHAHGGDFVEARLREAYAEAAAAGEEAVGKCARCDVAVYAMLSSEVGKHRFCSPRCATLFDHANPEAGVRERLTEVAKKAADDGVFEKVLSLDPERVAAIESRLRESAPPAASATSTRASSENQARESNR